MAVERDSAWMNLGQGMGREELTWTALRYVHDPSE
jgi:hypothetical protein